MDLVFLRVIVHLLDITGYRMNGLMTQFWLTRLQERFALDLKKLTFKERGGKTQNANPSL